MALTGLLPWESLYSTSHLGSFRVYLRGGGCDVDEVDVDDVEKVVVADVDIDDIDDIDDIYI